LAERVADYDRIAHGYDWRYGLHEYAGVRETLLSFVGSTRHEAILEVGCGTGHWLSIVQDRAAIVAGLDPSREMLRHAAEAVPRARLVRASAQSLPWRDEAFDRVFCVNALHHVGDRMRFFDEARRVLKPGGGLLSIGKDPHADRDQWWVYDYFPETIAIDRERFAPVRRLRGELALAGFTWAESFEADRIEAVRSPADALSAGIVDRAYTSQLTVLSDEEYEAGVARIRTATADLVTDFRLYATVGWLKGSHQPSALSHS